MVIEMNSRERSYTLFSKMLHFCVLQIMDSKFLEQVRILSGQPINVDHKNTLLSFESGAASSSHFGTQFYVKIGIYWHFLIPFASGMKN